MWILLKQETVSGSGIRWAICKSAPRSRQTTTPEPHHSVFLQTGWPSCRPTNSVNALKAVVHPAIDQYFLATILTAANLPHGAAVDEWNRQTDRSTEECFVLFGFITKQRDWR